MSYLIACFFSHAIKQVSTHVIRSTERKANFNEEIIKIFPTDIDLVLRRANNEAFNRKHVCSIQERAKHLRPYHFCEKVLDISIKKKGGYVIDH